MARLVPADDVQLDAGKSYRLVPADEPPSPRGPLVNVPALVDTARDIPSYLTRAIGGAFEGAGDVVVGAGQLASNLADPVIPGAADRYNNYMRSRENVYQGRRAALGGSSDQVDIGRGTGQFLAAMVGGGNIAAKPTLLGRIGQGATMGGTAAAVAPVDPNRQNYGAEKAVQIGLGTAAGAVAVPTVEGLICGTGAAVNFLGDKARGFANYATGHTGTQRIEQTLQVELQRWCRSAATKCSNSAFAHSCLERSPRSPLRRPSACSSSSASDFSGERRP